MKDFNDLILEFTEKSVGIKNLNGENSYNSMIQSLAEYLNISRIVLSYELSQEYSNLILDKYSHFTNKTFNILYDNLNGYDTSNALEFKYSHNDGSYTLIFYKNNNSLQWSNQDIMSIKLVANLSFNVISRLQLSEIFKSNQYYDYSTGVLNGSGLCKFLESLKSMEVLDEYSSIYLNIRRFKLINVQYSYSGGDSILKSFAITIYNLLEENENFFHIGGDNFVAIIHKKNKENLLKILSDFRLQYNNDLIYIHLYIGIYDIFSNDDVYTIMNNSNNALSIARGTPNSVYIQFTEEMQRQALEVKKIEQVMKSALVNGEFVTFYQPKVSIKTFELVGAEALVRWKQGDTIIPPYKFVPIFEKNGFICEIDFCMLENVCKSINEWISQGIKPVTISVNFSKLHLTNPNFVRNVQRTIQKYNIPTKYIEIEFTETLDVENYNSLVKINRDLKRCGIKTSIDDFGAGFSSLNLLKDVPVDVVKIDKSLIDYTASSTREKIIVQDIIKMAKTLDIEVIAEGVEDLDQLIFLQNIKCNQIQGYLFDKPLCVDDFKERLINENYYKNNPKFKRFIQEQSNLKINNKNNYGKFSLDLNNDFKIVDFDDGFCKIIGYSKDELLDNDFTMENLVIYDDWNYYKKSIQENFETSMEIYGEYKLIKKNGTKIYVMCLGTLKKDNIAEFMLSDISINKVTERENEILKSHFEFAQRELKNSNYMFEQITNTINGGIALLLLKGDILESIFCSNSFYNVLSCSRMQFDRYKNDVSKLFSDRDKSRIFNDIQECIDTGNSIINTYRFKCINGGEKILLVKIKSVSNTFYEYPLIHVVVAKYTDDIQQDLIDITENITILTEQSTFDIINSNNI